MVEEPPYKKKFHLDGALYNNCLYQNFVMHVQLVETRLRLSSPESKLVDFQTLSACKNSNCVNFCVIFSVFHIQQHLNTWKFSHFFIFSQSTRQERMKFCRLLRHIHTNAVYKFVESWRMLWLQFLKNNFFSLSFSK